MLLLPLLLYKPHSSNFRSLPSSHLEGSLLTNCSKTPNADRNYPFILHLGSRGWWNWSQLSWGEDGATSRQRTIHTDACGNFLSSISISLMCMSLHCGRKPEQLQRSQADTRENMQTPLRQSQHPISALANQFVFGRLTSMAFLKCFLIFPRFLKGWLLFSYLCSAVSVLKLSFLARSPVCICRSRSRQRKLKCQTVTDRQMDGILSLNSRAFQQI